MKKIIALAAVLVITFVIANHLQRVDEKEMVFFISGIIFGWAEN